MERAEVAQTEVCATDARFWDGCACQMRFSTLRLKWK